MKVYHASKHIIESPDVKHSRDLLDFGKGFYLLPLSARRESMPSVSFFKGRKLI